MEEVEFW
jgi:hypothetical protein